MADETLTGAKEEVTVDTAKVEQRKKIIKYVIMVVAVIAVGWFVWKVVLKK